MIYKAYADLLKNKGGKKHSKSNTQEANEMRIGLEALTNSIKNTIPENVVYCDRREWQNSGDITTYAWFVLTTNKYLSGLSRKKKDYSKLGYIPLTMSVFIEKQSNDYGIRVCLELFHKQCSHAKFLKYCEFLSNNYEKLKGLKIYLEDSSKHLSTLGECLTKQAFEKLLEDSKDGSKPVFFSVGLDYSIEEDDVKNEMRIKQALTQLLPIYEDIMKDGEDSSLVPAEEEKKKNPIKPKPMPKNIIFYGPPGTGKTYSTNSYCVAICDGVPLDDVIKMGRAAVNKRYQELYNEDRIVFVTFHQSYSYEDFVIGIFPEMKNGQLGYINKSGSFKTLCDNAKEDKRNYVIVIDEINRGNISKIFGELITLIEESRRVGEKEETRVTLPFADEQGLSKFSVPSNVYILGTMNTADRSIQHVDTALRRRFKFIEVGPNPSLLSGVMIKSEEKTVGLDKILSELNKRISRYYDREHVIGHSYFLPLCEEMSDEERLNMLGGIFHDQIIPLLQDYFFEDYGKIQKVLGESQDDETKNLVQREPDDEFDESEDVRPSYRIANLGKDSPFFSIETYIAIAGEK